MKFSPKVLAAIASVLVSLAGGGYGFHVYAPDGTYEDDHAVVKLYDNQDCKLPAGTPGAKHASVLDKSTGKEMKACYVEDKSTGLMLFITEGGGMAMAHRSMF